MPRTKERERRPHGALVEEKTLQKDHYKLYRMPLGLIDDMFWNVIKMEAATFTSCFKGHV